jgi:SAM-dependent methyltransferase
MDFTDDELASVTPDHMAAAYLEYRRSCYEFIYRAAVRHQIVDHLSTPATVDEFVVRKGVVPSKVEVARLLLDALTRCGAVGRSQEQPPRFAATPGYAPPSHIDIELIRLATGKRSYEELGYSDSFGRVVASLTCEEKPALAGFDASNIALWDQGMQLPYYRYSRIQAVDTLVSSGSNLLDLASGSGLGLLELAQRTGTGSTLVGVEISPDFVGVSAQRTASDPRIRVVQGDVEQPLSFLDDGGFDGAMLVGAYHYLSSPAALWHSMARLLRPGGVLCLAMAFSRTGSYDQELVNLRYAQRNPVAHARSRSEVLAAARGFELEREFWLGCFGWYAFRKQGQ